MAFFLEVLLGGLLAGVMYALVALGFVLIYRASGVFNFAQGAMLLFAALTYVSLVERGLPGWLALATTAGVMVLLAVVVERTVLRPLVNRSPLVLFMATLGLAYFIEGAAQALWGAQVHGLDLGIEDRPLELGERTRLGISLRAVADDPLAAQAVGIRLPRIWTLVWAVAGCVGLVAGLLWGARLGVQFSLSLIVLKALPVLIIGGFSSVSGAIVGGLLIGASEKLAEVYLGPLIGGGLENWFPYAFALVFLLIRPVGLFGEPVVERV